MSGTSARMRLALVAGILLVVAAIVGSGSAAAAGGAVIADPACTATPLNANDDGSSTLAPIGFTLDYFGQSFSQLFVNNNGNVTFDGALSAFTPFQLTTTGRKIIAPFFADVDTRGTASDIVRYGFGQTVFDGHPAFCADWVNVGYFSAHDDKLNSFQLLLVDRSDVSPGDFDIVMNYDKIQWETGDRKSVV